MGGRSKPRAPNHPEPGPRQGSNHYHYYVDSCFNYIIVSMQDFFAQNRPSYLRHQFYNIIVSFIMYVDLVNGFIITI